jgi:DNA-binding response OmpR family regulator
MMNVVVIDNDTALLKSLEILLGDHGYSVQSFSIAQEGYSYIEQGAPVDVLILDYAMPDLMGDELLKKARQFLSDKCTVILISGHSSLIDPLRIKDWGAQIFLPKPLDLERLYQVMGDCQEGNENQ